LPFPSPSRTRWATRWASPSSGASTLPAKPWKGQGAGVFEVVEDHDGNTYRAVYTVRFGEVVYVLHAFQKKSPRGLRTAQVDVDLVERRLKVAQQDYEARYGKPKR
jgi:phage-related protein